jgi:hypothetical protein
MKVKEVDTFSKVEYVDAFYISDASLEKVDLYPHISYGKITEDVAGNIVVSFIEDVESGTSVRGLLLPKGALLTEYKNNEQVMSGVSIGDALTVYWDDIVYFEKSVPEKITKMYTEGEVVQITSTYLLLKDPVTLRLHPQPVKNHPGYTPFYYVIPLSFITKVEK